VRKVMDYRNKARMNAAQTYVDEVLAVGRPIKDILSDLDDPLVKEFEDVLTFSGGTVFHGEFEGATQTIEVPGTEPHVREMNEKIMSLMGKYQGTVSKKQLFKDLGLVTATEREQLGSRLNQLKTAGFIKSTGYGLYSK